MPVDPRTGLYRLPLEDTHSALSQASFLTPRYLPQSSWLAHVPFAFWLVGALRPKVFVELGTQDGGSYFAFCQAAEQLGTGTATYAIDTWAGDAHAGLYNEQVYTAAFKYNLEHYSGFSTLIRSKFSDALQYFADGTVDLLHIDGRHYYNDVRSDYNDWKVKLSPNATVLFHDTNVRERGFGVWRFIEELAASHPCFRFIHGHGLGVVAPCEHVPSALGPLFAASPDSVDRIRAIYAALGARAVTQRALIAKTAGLHALLADRLVVSQESASAISRLADFDPQIEQIRLALAEAREAAVRADEGPLAEAIRADQAEAEARVARHAFAQASRERDEAVERLRAHESHTSAQHSSIMRLSAELAAANAAQAASADALNEVLWSVSWRVTRPLRRLAWAIPAPLRGAIHGGLRRLYRLATFQWRRLRDGEPEPDPAETESTADYDRWVREYDTLTNADRIAIRAHIARLPAHPTISIVMPAYETPETLLREAIASVQAQLYPHWELCVADDASPSDTVARVLREAAATDPRVKWTRRATNGHIAAATNSALGLATGAFVALMDHDDLLPERALYEVAVELAAHPDADLIFSDEDRISPDGHRSRPYFKPDWNIELMLGHNLINHLAVYRRSLIERVGGFREGVVDGSQDYDLGLRCVAQIDRDHIRHIPAILYHWRLADEASSFSQTNLDRCVTSARVAIVDFLNRSDCDACEVLPSPDVPSWTRVRYPVPSPPPRVSLIVPTRDRPDLLARCAEGLLHRTDYPDFELIIMDNQSSEPEALSLLNQLAQDQRVRVLPFAAPFNYSAVNNAAVRQATGDVIVLINNDIDVIEPDWLSEMVSLATRPAIGAVGAKLLFGDGRIQHAGVMLGVGDYAGGPGVAGHFGKFASREDVGPFGQFALTREVAAVTAACLAVRKDSYEAANGLDEINLPISFNDVDFCLKLRRMGLRNLWTPFATLYHLESASRGPDCAPEQLERAARESGFMRAAWGPELDNDPFLNPNLTRADETMRLAWPPRREKPWVRSTLSRT